METEDQKCIHGVPAGERCMECWPEESEEIIPPDDGLDD